MKRTTVKGVTKWLHQLAVASKNLASIEDYNDEIGVCKINTNYSKNWKHVPYVHLSNGLHEIADLLNFDVVKEEKEDDCEYVYYHFMFEDVMFIQLDKKEG